VAPPEAPARAVYYSNRAAARLSMARRIARGALHAACLACAHARSCLRRAQGHFAEAAEDCTAALQVDEGYVKARRGTGRAHVSTRTLTRPLARAQALVRRAQAYEKQGELEQLEKAFTGASLTLRRALTCTPERTLMIPAVLLSLCRKHARA
jgi:tetratricopeptide (TPR) repeat protein